MNTVSIAEVLGRGAAVQPHEVVAVVQQLIHRSAEDCLEAQPPFGPPSPENVLIRSDGTVVCSGCPTIPSIEETAILLQDLLAEAPSVPGGLQYAIGRALHDVEGVPFQSIADFSKALTRHEQGDRQAVVRGLLQRLEPETVSLAVVSPESSDRRSHPPIVAELRRQLRDVDRALFERQAALVSTPTAHRLRVPAIVAAVAAGLVTILAGQTLNLQREKTRAAGRNVVTTAPASATVAPPVSANIATPAPANVAVPVPADTAAAAPAKAAPVARATRVEPRSRTVRVAARRVASARAKTAGAKPGSRAPRAQKPRHRRWFGLRFFSG